MLTEFACARQELSCIIGNLFIEIEPPCERCGAADEITISGTTYTGSRAVLIITEHGFKLDGPAEEVERNKEKAVSTVNQTPAEGKPSEFIIITKAKNFVFDIYEITTERLFQRSTEN